MRKGTVVKGGNGHSIRTKVIPRAACRDCRPRHMACSFRVAANITEVSYRSSSAAVGASSPNWGPLREPLGDAGSNLQQDK